jgi:hypothetical protein
MTSVRGGYVRVVTAPRLYLATLLLVVVAFAGSFAVARALRDEPEARQPPMGPPMSELVELGQPAGLPPLRAQKP